MAKDAPKKKSPVEQPTDESAPILPIITDGCQYLWSDQVSVTSNTQGLTFGFYHILPDPGTFIEKEQKMYAKAVIQTPWGASIQLPQIIISQILRLAASTKANRPLLGVLKDQLQQMQEALDQKLEEIENDTDN